MVPDLYLDPQIRDWVLFPITTVMILVGILRHYVTLLIGSSPKKQTAAAIREQRALLRSHILRSTSTNSPLPPSYFHTISQSLSSFYQSGRYLKDGPRKPDDPGPSMNPLSDPSQMEGMMENMKKQMIMNIPQMVIMGWISFYFSGFVMIKLPFPVTYGFKSMLQRGIETPDMDVRWVSSLSWYFLNLFGLNGLFRLLLGADNVASSAQDPASSPFAAMANNAAPAQPGQDFNKLFLAEKDNLELAEGLYKWSADGVEQRILQKYGKLPASSLAQIKAKDGSSNKRKVA